MLDPKSADDVADAESAMRTMLVRLLNPLVDHPEQCSVETVRLDGSSLFVVYVAREDMQELIGEKMRTGKSLQILVGAVGAKSQRRFSLTFRDAACATAEERVPWLPTIIKGCD